MNAIQLRQSRNLINRFLEGCSICGKPFTSAQIQAEEIQQTANGPACADCYYDELSAEIERKPFCRPCRPR